MLTASIVYTYGYGALSKFWFVVTVLFDFKSSFLHTDARTKKSEMKTYLEMRQHTEGI